MENKASNLIVDIIQYIYPLYAKSSEDGIWIINYFKVLQSLKTINVDVMWHNEQYFYEGLLSMYA
jgi:competence transcription factor ComK